VAVIGGVRSDVRDKKKRRDETAEQKTATASVARAHTSFARTYFCAPV